MNTRQPQALFEEPDGDDDSLCNFLVMTQPYDRALKFVNELFHLFSINEALCWWKKGAHARQYCGVLAPDDEMKASCSISLYR